MCQKVLFIFVYIWFHLCIKAFKKLFHAVKCSDTLKCFVYILAFPIPNCDNFMNCDSIVLGEYNYFVLNCKLRNPFMVLTFP